MAISITELPILLPRPMDGHKGLFGRVLIVGGSMGMTGAVALAGKAALRSGAGLVKVACPAICQPIVAALDACYTTAGLAATVDGQFDRRSAGELLALAQDSDVVVFGPGAGKANGVLDCLLPLLQIENLPILIDADGLNAVATVRGRSIWEQKKAQVIITPHPGEMKRLWSAVFRSRIPTQRSDQAVQMAKTIGAVVVLKGAGTVVSDGQKIYINTTGNVGMATAGAGDVLCGVIAALIGQGLSLLDAGVLGVYLHGRAGDLAARSVGKISLIATDIIDYLKNAFLELPPQRQ